MAVWLKPPSSTTLRLSWLHQGTGVFLLGLEEGHCHLLKCQHLSFQLWGFSGCADRMSVLVWPCCQEQRTGRPSLPTGFPFPALKRRFCSFTSRL